MKNLKKFIQAWNEGSPKFSEIDEKHLKRHLFNTRQSILKQYSKDELAGHYVRMSIMGYPAVEIAMKKLQQENGVNNANFVQRWIFHFGDYFESYVLLMMREFGLSVEAEQAEVVYKHKKQKVVGHIDAVVDGVLVDVKTMGYYIRSFREVQDDDRGYVTQGHLYLECMRDFGLKQFAWVCYDKFTNKLELIEMEWDDHYLERVNYILSCLPKIKQFEDIAKYFEVPPLIVNGHKKEVPQCMRYSEHLHLFYEFDKKGKPVREKF